MTSTRGGSGRRLANSPFAPPDAGPRVEFAVGDRVSHDRHGLGWVRAVHGGTTMDVDFGGTVGVVRIDTSSKRVERL